MGELMIRKLAIGLLGLGVIGGGAWAGVQYFGDQDRGQAVSDDEEDKEYFRVGRGGPVQVDANGFPLLRNGLWNVTTTTDGVTMTAKICLDDAFQREASLFSLKLNGSICPTPPTIAREGAGFITTRTCALGPVQLVDTTRITGDMQRSYRRQSEMITTGPGVPPQTSAQLEEGAYVGACPSDMAGGDMDMNGGRINARMLLAIGGAAALPTGALEELDFSQVRPPSGE